MYILLSQAFCGRNDFSEVCRGAGIPGMDDGSDLDRREVSQQLLLFLLFMGSDFLAWSLDHSVTCFSNTKSSLYWARFLFKNEPGVLTEATGPPALAQAVSAASLLGTPPLTLSVPCLLITFKVPRSPTSSLTQGLHRCCSVSSPPSPSWSNQPLPLSLRFQRERVGSLLQPIIFLLARIVTFNFAIIYFSTP